MLSYVRSLPKYLRAGDPPGAETTSEAAPENLYHVLFTTADRNKDVNSVGERNRLCGTYTSLPAAKAAAHRCLFDAGYEREWFEDFETSEDDFRAHGVPSRKGLAVLAKAPDGTVLRVYVLTSPNTLGLAGDDEHVVHDKLYHVVQTNILYAGDASAERRETNIEGSFRSKDQARDFARRVLLNPDDGVTRESFAEYDEAQANEPDSGYLEDVVVHAAGQDGENYLVAVLEDHEMEAVRLAEAARQIR